MLWGMSTHLPASLTEAVQLLERGELAAAGRHMSALPGTLLFHENATRTGTAFDAVPRG
jgi:hypothetical protein